MPSVHGLALWLSFGITAKLVAGDDFDEEGSMDLLTWARKGGATIEDSLSVGEDPKTGLRGLLAGGDLASGAVLISVPKSMLLFDSYVQSDYNPAWKECCSEGDEVGGKIHTAFALYFLQLREQGYSPWASSLPESFDSFPLFWSKEELDGFQSSPVRRQIELDQNGVANDYKAVLKAMPSLSIEDFRWARCAVKSRVFGLKSLSKNRLTQEIIAMAPLADFVNHAPDGIVEVNVSPEYDVDSGLLTFRTTREIKAGEGIYWDYGFTSNRASLLRYGFTSMKRVPRTDMPFFFKLNKFPRKAASSKKAKLDQIAIAEKAGTLIMDPDGTVLHELSLTMTGRDADRLLGHMRFMVLEPGANAAEVLSGCCADTYCQPISEDNEKKALVLFMAHITRLLKSYRTSADDDKTLIDSGNLSAKDGAVWHTLVVRYGEKRILFGMTRMLEALIDLLERTPENFAEQVKERWNNRDSPVHRYVLETLVELRAGKTCGGYGGASIDSDSDELPVTAWVVGIVGVLVVLAVVYRGSQSRSKKSAKQQAKKAKAVGKNA